VNAVMFVYSNGLNATYGVVNGTQQPIYNLDPCEKLIEVKQTNRLFGYGGSAQVYRTSNGGEYFISGSEHDSSTRFRSKEDSSGIIELEVEYFQNNPNRWLIAGLELEE